jgi:hypothetical protein
MGVEIMGEEAVVAVLQVLKGHKDLKVQQVEAQGVVEAVPRDHKEL